MCGAEVGRFAGLGFKGLSFDFEIGSENVSRDLGLIFPTLGSEFQGLLWGLGSTAADLEVGI